MYCSSFALAHTVVLMVIRGRMMYDERETFLRTARVGWYLVMVDVIAPGFTIRSDQVEADEWEPGEEPVPDGFLDEDEPSQMEMAL